MREREADRGRAGDRIVLRLLAAQLKDRARKAMVKNVKARRSAGLSLLERRSTNCSDNRDIAPMQSLRLRAVANMKKGVRYVPLKSAHCHRQESPEEPRLE